MKARINSLIAFTSIAMFAAGCASAPSKFYTLNSTAQDDGKKRVDYAITVGPVSIPMEVDRPEFTVRISSNRVAIDEFNRWAEPLNSNIARVVAGDLATLLGTPRVISVPMANFAPDYRVTIDIQRFESAPGKSAQLEAVWVVRKSNGGQAVSGRTIAIEPVTDDSFNALAAAHSRALAKVSSDIAAAIRAEANKKQ
ncbi:MAG: PqiC family protein [Victivallaceae bacterium]